MNRTQEFNQEVLSEVRKWGGITEYVIEKVMRRKRVKHSKPGSKRVHINVVRSGDMVNAEMAFPTTLRFVDMGSGRGYSHGKRISSGGGNRRAYYKVGLKKFQLGKKGLRKVRKVKKITTRPIFARIHQLESIMAVNLGDETILTIRQALED